MTMSECAPDVEKVFPTAVPMTLKVFAFAPGPPTKLMRPPGIGFPLEKSTVIVLLPAFPSTEIWFTVENRLAN